MIQSNKIKKSTAILLIAVFSVSVLLFGSCSSSRYMPEKVNYTTKPSGISKSKRINRNYSRPMAKQVEPLEKKYIIKNTRTTSPPW